MLDICGHPNFSNHVHGKNPTTWATTSRLVECVSRKLSCRVELGLVGHEYPQVATWLLCQMGGLNFLTFQVLSSLFYIWHITSLSLPSNFKSEWSHSGSSSIMLLVFMVSESFKLLPKSTFTELASVINCPWSCTCAREWHFHLLTRRLVVLPVWVACKLVLFA